MIITSKEMGKARTIFFQPGGAGSSNETTSSFGPELAMSNKNLEIHGKGNNHLRS